MLHRPPPFRLLAITCLLLGGSIGKSLAQADGFTLQERPGIALVKPQPWSKDADATVAEFEAFIDRTASGGGAAGYYEFHSKAGTKKQVPSSRVVKMVVYPDPQLIPEIVNTSERAKLQSTIDEIKSVVAKFPATKAYLDPSLKKLGAELAQFDSGKVKTNNIWIPKAAYMKEQANKLLGLIKGDISRANPPGSFDLENDPRYVALKEYSASDPTIKASTTELADSYARVVRAEKRKALLARLANPTLVMPEAQVAVAQLKSLKPEEDARSAAFVKAWDSGAATVKDISADGAKLATALEDEMKPVTTEDAAPQFSPGLDKEISALNDKMTIFVASKPPQQFLTESKQALAVCATGIDFKKLATLFQEKQFLMAKDLLDNLSRQSANIGPETSRVIGGLQRFTATKIDEFTRLREEAKLLAGSGKQAEALVKYEDAFTVIPDPGVGDEIAKLKPADPAATPKP